MMQRINKQQFFINDNVHILHAKYQFDIICNKSTVRPMGLLDRIMQNK